MTAIAFLLTSSLLAGSGSVPPPPKVEYVRSEGKDCLQPMVRVSAVTVKDYFDAARRWLNAAYPGMPTPEFTNVLSLGPARPANPPGMQQVHHGPFSVKVVGPHETVTVCFDVGLTALEPGP